MRQSFEAAIDVALLQLEASKQVVCDRLLRPRALEQRRRVGVSGFERDRCARTREHGIRAVQQRVSGVVPPRWESDDPTAGFLDGVEGGYTRDFTQEGGPQSFIYDAAQHYAEAGIPLVVLAGWESVKARPTQYFSGLARSTAFWRWITQIDALLRNPL